MTRLRLFVYLIIQLCIAAPPKDSRVTREGDLEVVPSSFAETETEPIGSTAYMASLEEKVKEKYGEEPPPPTLPTNEEDDGLRQLEITHYGGAVPVDASHHTQLLRAALLGGEDSEGGEQMFAELNSEVRARNKARASKGPQSDIQRLMQSAQEEYIASASKKYVSHLQAEREAHEAQRRPAQMAYQPYEAQGHGRPAQMSYRPEESSEVVQQSAVEEAPKLQSALETKSTETQQEQSKEFQEFQEFQEFKKFQEFQKAQAEGKPLVPVREQPQPQVATLAPRVASTPERTEARREELAVEDDNSDELSDQALYASALVKTFHADALKSAAAEEKEEQEHRPIGTLDSMWSSFLQLSGP